jgi:hypothetical protein
MVLFFLLEDNGMDEEEIDPLSEAFSPEDNLPPLRRILTYYKSDNNDNRYALFSGRVVTILCGLWWWVWCQEHSRGDQGHVQGLANQISGHCVQCSVNFRLDFNSLLPCSDGRVWSHGLEGVACL